MVTEVQLDIAKRILNSGLVTKVFHSCQLLRDQNNNQLYPVYPLGNEYTYEGIDDTHGLFAYIRSNGDYVGVPLKVTSCARSYNMTAPLRVVFFHDDEDRDQDLLIAKLSQFTFMQGVTLVRVITDKLRLQREESQLFRSNFDGKTFYVAFDVLAAFLLLPSTCETNACIVHPNPLTPCPAAAPPSSSSATS